MFQPLSLFVGLRYVRARNRKFFVSFITWVSLLGVCLGVAALIVILSVMNGFEGELRDRLLALTAHARIIVVPVENAAVAAHAASAATSANTSVEASVDIAGPERDDAVTAGREDWERIAALASRAPEVTGAAPYVEIQALALHSPEMLPVQLRGIDPARESAVTEAANSMIEGRLADLVPGTDRVVLGSVIARLLAVDVGDRLTLLVPGVGSDGAPQPRLREFTVTGLFEVGLQDHDGVLVLADLDDVRALTAGDPRAAGVRLKFRDPMRAPLLAAQLQATLPAGYAVRDWTQDHANYFRAIRIEKTMMALILLLIVAVAAFNIVAMLVMVVNDKRTDIAILRTFGARPRTVMGAFITQGVVIGWAGVLAGLGLGVLGALNVGRIVPALEKLFRFRMFDADVYYITRIPSELHVRDLVWIAAAELLLTLGATLYPALRAARTPPAEALRYE